MAADTEIDNLLALHGLERRRWLGSETKPTWRVYRCGEREPVSDATLYFSGPIQRYIDWIEHDFDARKVRPHSLSRAAT